MLTTKLQCVTLRGVRSAKRRTDPGVQCPMQKSRWPAASVLLGAAALLLAAAHPAGAGAPGDPVPVPASLAVAVDPGTAPATGFDRELFGEIGRELGVAVRFAEVPRAAALAGLGTGLYDVVAGPLTAAEAGPLRALPPVARRGDALLKRRGDGGLLVPADLAGKVVGIAGDPATVARLRRAVSALRARATLRPAWRAAALPDDLAAGRLAAIAGSIEAVAGTALSRAGAFEVVGPLPGPSVPLAPVMRPSAAAAPLGDAMAAAIGRIRADGRLAALQRKWFGVPLEPQPPAPRPAAAPASKP